MSFMRAVFLVRRVGKTQTPKVQKSNKLQTPGAETPLIRLGFADWDYLAFGLLAFGISTGTVESLKGEKVEMF
jgi:hypothetical protein